MTTVNVCSDCLDAVEFTDDELGYPEGTLAAHYAKMVAYAPYTASHRFIVEIGKDEDFSVAECEGCGSRYAGARFTYTLMPV